MHLPSYWFPCFLVLATLAFPGFANAEAETHAEGLYLETSSSFLPENAATDRHQYLSAFGRSHFFSHHAAPLYEQLGDTLPLRLPTHLYLLSVPNDGSEQVTWQVIHPVDAPGLTLALQVCSHSGLGDCVAAEFGAIAADSEVGQAAISAHQVGSYPFSLAPDIQGYYKEVAGDRGAIARILWEQDRLVYRVELPAIERHHVLYMAAEMAGNPPLSAGEREIATLPTDSSSTGEMIASTSLPILHFENPTLDIAQTSEPTGSPSVTDDAASTVIDINTVPIVGSTLFTEEEIRQILLEEQAKSGDPSTPDNLALWLTQAYINLGYITSSAIPTDDFLGLQVIEGSLGPIEICSVEDDDCNDEIDFPLEIDEAYLRSRIERVATTPLNFDRLEEALRLLRSDPLFDNIEASLGLSGQEGESILRVRVDEADPVVYGVSINNESAPSLGAEQAEVGFTHFNLTGRGDRLSAHYARSFEGGLSHVQGAYQLPLNPMDGTLRVSAEFLSTEVVEPEFDELNIEGDTYRYAVWLRQPLIRKPQEELALSLGFTYTSGQTFFLDRLPTPFGFGPDENGFSRTSVLSFGQDYVYREASGAWAFNSQFNLGVPIFNATQNDAPVPDGEFFSWQGLAQRVQRLGNDHLLIVQLDTQLTPYGLLPSESYSIGGVNSVRGYRAGARTGDNGVHLYLEDRITVKRDGAGRSMVTLRPFFDLGAVWNHPDNPNTIPSPTFLMGTGLGLTVENLAGFEGLSFRADYGLPLIDLGSDKTDLQDHGFYFSINYNSDPNRY